MALNFVDNRKTGESFFSSCVVMTFALMVKRNQCAKPARAWFNFNTLPVYPRLGLAGIGRGGRQRSCYMEATII